MFAQTEIAIKNGWLPLQKVLGQKDIIYTALPGLTILAALEASKRHDGIPLICGKVINSHNCPQEENFPQFVASILKIREKYLTLREEELYIIRHKLCCNKEVPDHLKRFDTTELMEFKAVVYGMAATISQSRIFLQMTPVVFSECCKLFADEKQPISPGPGRK